MAEQDTPLPTITAMKIPIIKKGKYDIWSMRIRDQSGPFAPPVPKTAKQLAAKRNQEREAIKSRFGGNEESKKMQKNVLKHQFENFTTASNESLDKAYDRSLPPSWNQIALIMRNKPDIDEIDIDDLYNNLRVYEDEMKRSSSSTSTSQNLAFLSSENTSSTNERALSLHNQQPVLNLKMRIFSRLMEMAGGDVDCQGEEIHSEDRKELGFQRKTT
ncbi:hypothetical protein Tco_0324416, partial [Tanacetum coccineum]